MIKHNQDGAANGLVISLILTVVFLVAALGFGGWAFSSQQYYKNNSDTEAAIAAKAAVAVESKRKDLIFNEEYKKPLKIYNGPEAYGSINMSYPKTWSGYVATATDADPPLDGYFSPNVVPSVNDETSIFAVRIQVVNRTYSSVLEEMESAQKDGSLAVSAYALKKLPKVTGIKAVGKLSSGDASTVTMVVLPLRSGTLKIWTEGSQYVPDFETNILPNFTFSP